MNMKTLLKIILLGITLVIVFVSPAQIGIVGFYSLFPLLFLLVYFFYIVSYAVSEEDVRKVRIEPFSFSLFCGMVPLIGDGDLTRGRLVITDKKVALYKRIDRHRTKQTPCEEVWSLDVSEIRSLGVGKVLSSRSGLIFYLDEGSVHFVTSKAKKQKSAIIKALGWEKAPAVPQEVEVFAEAASAPSFNATKQQEE